MTKKVKIYPIYVLAGKDRRLAIDKLDELTDFLLGDADPQLALEIYEGDRAELAMVLDALRTLPFLAERRIVVIKQADSFITKYRGELEQYLEKPAETGVLVMLADSFPATTRLAKATKKIGKIIKTAPASMRELPGFLAQYATEKHELSLSSNCASMLIELVGQDSGVLLSEIDKIAAFVKGPGSHINMIKPKDIQEIVGDNKLHTVFNVIDAMTVGKTGLALEHLDKMLNQNKDAEFSAVGALAWHFRRLYDARVLLDQGHPAGEIIQKLRIWNQKEQFIGQVRGMKITDAAKAITMLADIDYHSKIGKTTPGDGLEKMIITFCNR
ncbi:MAG: DNA polymerase III subunit delta [Phycisphaerae bacterium]|nr:DNA polymerase III subunit delta [Phycisphaerae bacterium]